MHSDSNPSGVTCYWRLLTHPHGIESTVYFYPLKSNKSGIANRRAADAEAKCTFLFYSAAKRERPFWEWLERGWLNLCHCLFSFLPVCFNFCLCYIFHSKHFTLDAEKICPCKCTLSAKPIRMSMWLESDSLRIKSPFLSFPPILPPPLHFTSAKFAAITRQLARIFAVSIGFDLQIKELTLKKSWLSSWLWI